MTLRLINTITETIEYLNSVAGTNYSHANQDTINALSNLTNAGYSLEDFKYVIDKKWQDWKGTKYQQYVRPSTLFGKKFENYLNEQRTPKANKLQQLNNAVQRAKQANWRMDKK